MLEKGCMFLQAPIKPEREDFSNGSVDQSINAVHIYDMLKYL